MTLKDAIVAELRKCVASLREEMRKAIAESTQDTLREVRRGVREEVRMELLLAGLVDVPIHWETMDRKDLAAHLRELAERLDPKGRDDAPPR